MAESVKPAEAQVVQKAVRPQKPKVVSQEEANPRPSRLRSTDPVVDAILAYQPFELVAQPKRRSHSALSRDWGLESRRLRAEDDHANAFLYGVIADRMVKAEKAWRVPFALADRLGHLDMHRIAKMKTAELRAVLESPTKLHRFNEAMAKAYIGLAQHLVANHRGVASNMWPDGVDARALLTELESLQGISHKLSAMTLQILVRNIGVRVRGMPEVDIAVDRHVARVFLRTGLVGRGTQKVYRVGEVRDEVIAVARRSLPQFPGAIDLGAFFIGKAYCTHADPNCAKCPLHQVCPRDRKSWAIGVASGARVKAE